MSAELLDMIRQLDEHDQEAVEAFVSTLRDYRAAGPTARLPGLPDVDDAALDAAVSRNEARLWAEREQLYEQSLSRAEAARRIGVSTNQITNLLREGDLLSLDGPDGVRLPPWQFDPESRRGRLDGIAAVSAVFPGGVLWLSSWIRTPNPQLTGQTPHEVLVRGDIAAVVAAAGAIGS